MYSCYCSCILCLTLFQKVLSNSCHDLGISHLINCLNARYAIPETLALKTLDELALCLTRPQDQDRVSVTYMGDHLVVVLAEMLGKLPVSLILTRALLRR